MSAPTLVPRSDQIVHFVLNDFGNLGCAFVETDEIKSDEWTIVSNIAKGHYSNPVKVIAVDIAEGWCRDVTEQIAQAVFELGRRENSFSGSARDFIERTLGISLFPTR